jgi:hypothetical protein
MVLTLVLVGLGVFIVLRPLKEVVTAPSVFWMVIAIAFSALGCWWADENPLWCFAAAGFAHFWYRLDQIVEYLRDWVKLAPLRNQPRR